MKKSAFTLGVLALLVSAQVAAANPFSFSYGGRFTNPSGNGLTGSVSIEVAFFRAATGGSPVLAPVTINGVQLVDGVFQVALTSLTAAEVHTVFSTSDDVWVQITDTTHNVTLPRQLTQATPYALKVPVDGQSITYDSSGLLTLGAEVNANKLVGNAVSGSAPNSGDVLAWDGAQWAPTAGGVSGVSSVNSRTGAVTLTSSDIAEGTNQYFTNARARSALSGTGAIAYNSATGVISAAQANGSTAGFLSSADWTTFNNKQNALANSDGLAEGSTNLYFSNARARSALSASGAISYNSTTGVVSAAQASGSTDGFLSSADWTTFSNKQAAITGSTNLSLGSVTSATQGGVVLNPFGASAGQTGESRFKELAANGANYVGFKAADALAGNVVWTLPNADGSSGQVLTTNGSGVLSWVAQTTAPVSSVNGQTGAVSLSTTNVSEGTNQYFTNARARSALSGTAPVSFNSGTGAISMAQANGSTAGFLSSADWTTFNNKQNALANSDGLAEGSTNLYYTNARARSALSASGALAYDSGTGALSLNALTDSEISASAAIARSKLESGTADQVLINDGSGVLSSEAQLATSRGGTGVNSTATFPTSGVVVTEAAAQTLTNKTISGASNTLTNLSASNVTSGNLKADYFQDMRTSILMFEDFFCTSAITNCQINWTSSVSTAAVAPVSSTVANHPGLVRFSGGTGGTHYASAIHGTTTIKNTLLGASSGTITLESSITVPSAAGATMRFGLCSTLNAAGTCTDGVYFLLTGAATNTSVKAEVMAGGTAYGPAANTTSYAAGSFHSYRIVITNNTSAAFYVDGTLLDTITTSSPYSATFPSVVMNPAFKYSYVSAAQNIDVDYFGFRQQFSSAR